MSKSNIVTISIFLFFLISLILLIESFQSLDTSEKRLEKTKELANSVKTLKNDWDNKKQSSRYVKLAINKSSAKEAIEKKETPKKISVSSKSLNLAQSNAFFNSIFNKKLKINNFKITKDTNKTIKFDMDIDLWLKK